MSISTVAVASPTPSKEATSPTPSKKDVEEQLAAVVELIGEERLTEGHRIIRRNVYWALGLGLVPVPLLDIVTLTGVQVKLLQELSNLYKVKFFENTAKNIIGSLVSGMGPVALAAVLGGSLTKLIPVAGLVVGLVAVPITAGAFTYALGKVFLMHFESGGSLLDFDPAKMREHFRKEFELAKDEVIRIQKEKEELSKGTDKNKAA